MSEDEARRSVVIVGGGFSGLLTAIQLIAVLNETAEAIAQN